MRRWAACIASTGGSDDGRGVEGVEAEPVGERGVELAVHGQLGDDGVHLALVAVVARDGLPPVDERLRRSGRVPQPAQERGVRVAGGDDDRRFHDGAVVQLDAPHALALAQDRRSPANRCGSVPRPASNAPATARGTAPLPPTGRPTLGDVLHGQRQGTQARPRRVRGEAPHAGTDDDGRRHDGVLREEGPQDVGHAAPAPAEQGGDAAGPPAGDRAQRRPRGAGASLASSTTSSASGSAARR